MNKLTIFLFISLFSLLVNTIYLRASGLFSGYRMEDEKALKERSDSIKFNFPRTPQTNENIPQENNPIEEYYKEDSSSQESNVDPRKIYKQQNYKEDQSNNKPEVNSRKIFISQPSSNRIVNSFIYDNNNSTSSNKDEVLDSGIPVNIESSENPEESFSVSSARNYSPYRIQQLRTQQNKQPNNSTLGSVDVSVYHSKLPANYKSKLSNTEINNARKLTNKKPTKYPNFLLFANDVICTTQAGITDGMIFYTPHGTYKLKGNLLISSNDTYLISGNRIWLDDMIYYFDDSGVYLNNKVYNFKNNVMYRDGVKYQVEGTIVVTEGLTGNHRCIVSELIE